MGSIGCDLVLRDAKQSTVENNTSPRKIAKILTGDWDNQALAPSPTVEDRTERSTLKWGETWDRQSSSSVVDCCLGGSNSYCSGHLHDGLIILGAPIGTPTYIFARVRDFTLAFTRATHQLQLVQSPLLASASTSPVSNIKYPVDFCWQQLRPCLRTLPYYSGAQSPWLSSWASNKSPTNSFVGDLTTAPTLADSSWLLATLPVRSGGLGFLALSSLALLSFLRPLLRTIKDSITVITILDFASHAAPQPPNAPPPDPFHWIIPPPHLTLVFSNWETSTTIPWLTRFTHRDLPPYLQVADPDILPSTF
jgi:hypothetical protein